MEHHHRIFRLPHSEFAKLILYTVLMLLPLAVAAAIYTGDPWLPLFLGLYLLDILARIIIVYWPVTLAIIAIWLAYDLFSETRRKKKDQAASDEQESVQSSG